MSPRLGAPAVSLPRTDAAQPRLEPPALGMVLFLVSEVMFFGSLFAAYFYLRGRTSPWPPSELRLEVVEPAVATVLLVASSGTLQLAERAATRGQGRRAATLVLLTGALGAIFLASQVRTWIVDDFGIGTDAYGSMFTTMTGFHAIHVAGGLALMLAMLPAFAGTHTSPGGVVATVYYWHFVDVVWIGVFATLFFVR